MNSSVEQNQATSEYQSNIDLLRSIPLFSGLPIEALKLLAYLCVRTRFKPGEYLFRQEDADAAGYYFISGSTVLTRMQDGREEIVRSIVEGEFIGGLSLLCGSKRLFSLRAESPVVCMVISREMFQKLWEQFPGISRVLIAGISSSLYTWDQRLLALESRCPNCLNSLGVTLV